MVRNSISEKLQFTKFSSTTLPVYVQNMVEIEGGNKTSSFRLYPRNTPEILINLADPIQGEMDNRNVSVNTITIQGCKTKYVKAHHPPSCHFISLRFTANGYYKLLGLPQNEFTDRLFPLDHVKKKVEDLIPLLKNAPTKKDRFLLINSWLHKLMDHVDISHDLLSDFIMREIYRDPSISVRKLSEKTGYSRKHLAQTFRKEVGLTIKSYQKIHRINRVLKFFSESEIKSFAQLAYKFGFYDQSHLIKDFKRFTGYTPTDYQRLQEPARSIAG